MIEGGSPPRQATSLPYTCSISLALNLAACGLYNIVAESKIMAVNLFFSRFVVASKLGQAGH
jgi:hypothetical protein